MALGRLYQAYPKSLKVAASLLLCFAVAEENIDSRSERLTVAHIFLFTLQRLNGLPKLFSRPVSLTNFQAADAY